MRYQCQIPGGSENSKAEKEWDRNGQGKCLMSGVVKEGSPEEVSGYALIVLEQVGGRERKPGMRETRSGEG